MASKVALAKKAERNWQELQDRLDRIEQAVATLQETMDRLELGAAKTAPAKRASRQKRTGHNA